MSRHKLFTRDQTTGFLRHTASNGAIKVGVPFINETTLGQYRFILTAKC